MSAAAIDVDRKFLNIVHIVVQNFLFRAQQDQNLSLGVAKVGFRAESVREDGVAVVNAGGALLLINRPDVVLLEVPEQLNLKGIFVNIADVSL